MLAVASATPSMNPSHTAPTPSVPTTNTGSSAWISSDEMSMNRLTNPSAQMPAGKSCALRGAWLHAADDTPIPKCNGWASARVAQSPPSIALDGEDCGDEDQQNADRADDDSGAGRRDDRRGDLRAGPLHPQGAGRGLAFSEFKGYETRRTISISHNGDKLALILGNPAMIKAYESGIPGNGKPFPDGAKMAKIHWEAKKQRGAARSADRRGRPARCRLHGEGQQSASPTAWMGLRRVPVRPCHRPVADRRCEDQPPQANDAKCGAACHTVAKDKDYVFTEYPSADERSPPREPLTLRNAARRGARLAPFRTFR